jgi:glutathione S-transferase
MARIVVSEKELSKRVEIIVAQTRTADSPYYKINPSGRVPYLVRDDGVGYEESALICAYLDHVDNRPAFDLPISAEPWEGWRMEAYARSLLDGLAVWGRERARPKTEQSPFTIEHERVRAERMIDLWESKMDHPVMRGALNMAQVTLACALGLEVRNPEFVWRARQPKLASWYDRLAARPSFRSTLPPPV